MPARPRSLKKNFGYAFAGNAFYQACQMGMFVALAKVLSPEDVGRFALGLAISQPILIFASLNLRAVQVTDVKDENSFGDFISLRLVTVVLAMLVIAGIAVFSGYPMQTAVIIFVIGLNHSVAITREVFQSYMQKYERLDHVAISQAISGALALVALVATVVVTKSLVYGVIAMLIARLLTFATWDRYSVKAIYNAVREPGSGPLIRLNGSVKVLSVLAWMALPAALMAVMTRFVTVLPQYFVEGMLGTEMLGFYAALAALPVFGQMAVRAAGTAALPRLSRMFAERRPGFMKLTIKLALVGAAIGVVGVLIAVFGGKPLVTALYTAEYAQYQEAFIWLMVYGGVSYCAACIGYALHATRWFWIQPAMFVVILTLVAFFCWLWVPTHGLSGAAMAMIVGRVAQIPIAIGVIIWACARRPAPEPAEPATPAPE